MSGQPGWELAPEWSRLTEVSYENGVITAAELNDARLSLLETEWELMQAKYGQRVDCGGRAHTIRGRSGGQKANAKAQIEFGRDNAAGFDL